MRYSLNSVTKKETESVDFVKVESKISFTLARGANIGSFEFGNNKTYKDNYSHTDVLVNKFTYTNGGLTWQKDNKKAIETN